MILKKTKYTSDELIYTGLPNLDVFIDHRNKTVERKLITFFLTWRLWDTNGEIKPGSYLKRYIDFFELIKTDSFYKGKEIRVILHPKAREILLEQFPDEYSKIKDTVYEGNIKSALLDTKVFITDYSSSVFFAYAAGAYPVFYWEDKEVAEYHYKSPNFLQENNVFGPVAYNYECLNDLIKTEYNKDDLSPLDEKYLYFVDRVYGNNTEDTFEYIYKKILV